MTKIKLSAHEQVVAVTPEYASGPGWSNRPLWIHIVSHADGKYRCECLQPEDQSYEQIILFPVLAAAHNAMMSHIATLKVKK